MIKFTKVHPFASIPKRANEHAAGFDLYSVEEYEFEPGERCLLTTGVAMALERGFWGEIKPRSGMALNNGIDVMAGVIDSDYRGEIQVLLINHGGFNYTIKPGDRIAQIVIQRHYSGLLSREVASLDETDRGASGYGSTGR